MTIYTTGVNEIDAVLRGLPLQVSDKLLQSAFADAAKPMVEAAKSFAPTGETDNLVNSIGILKSRSMSDARSVGSVQVGPIRGGSRKGYIGHIIEYGTITRRTKSGANRGEVTPNQFMHKAVSSQSGNVKSRINVSVGKKVLSFMKRTIKKSS